MFSYLHEILVTLDLSNPNIRDYLYSVLVELNKKLMAYIQTNSTPMSKRFQMLYMACQGLMQKIAQQRATPIKQLAPSSTK